MLPQQTCWMPCHKHIEWCSRLDNLEPHFTLYLLLVLVERASLPSHKSWGRGLVTIFLKVDAVNFPRALGTVRIPDRDSQTKAPSSWASLQWLWCWTHRPLCTLLRHQLCPGLPSPSQDEAWTGPGWITGTSFCSLYLSSSSEGWVPGQLLILILFFWVRKCWMGDSSTSEQSLCQTNCHVFVC